MATVQYTIVFIMMVSELPMPDRWKQGIFTAFGKSKTIRSKIQTDSKIKGVSGVNEKTVLEEKQKIISALNDKLVGLEKELKEAKSQKKQANSNEQFSAEVDDAEVIKAQLAKSNVRRRNV
ncbi:hypothetical protein AYI70_g398 [Smittium culicis]|uniref:Uncharacterized protein n=1 Tax=Smittium culicis TaxID=133412 RepID=A0A1R1YGX6_9FUNG|nr:hypothetical protein AYI70_g5554 [Smittium culicis]OMJ26149.1 hypothetical protein AYI70_g398 [Smittium culicis]